MTARLPAVIGDRRGATMLEFTIILPAMLMLIMGLGDLAYQAYVQAILTGAVQKAGRDGMIQGNASATAGGSIDQKVMQQVQAVARSATWTSTRKNYSKFSNIAPEPYQDNNGNGIYDAATECFTDLNGNRQRDLDPGANGQGGANDAVVYTMTVQYDRLFPLASLLGWEKRPTISASTVLKNQPYALQNGITATTVCPK